MNAIQVIGLVFTVLGGFAALFYFWDKIRAFVTRRSTHEQSFPIHLASNQTKDNIEAVILDSDPHKDWNHQSDTWASIVFYRSDPNLRFEMKYTDDGVQCQDFREPWANKFLHASATGYWCRLYYGSTPIDKFVLVSVDDGGAMLPIPKMGASENGFDQVLPLDYAVARIHDTLGSLDKYMTQAGLTVYTGDS